MLAYRHGFHAGNHGDVLKHVVLVHLLGHLGAKPTPFLCVDTHAGAGLYLLADRFAQTTGEHAHGIGRIWSREDAPAAVAEYLALVRRFNADGTLRQYPGSPAIAQALLRAKDRLHLFELHPTDFRALTAHFGREPGCRVALGDGFETLRSQLPPVSRRALVLIDPSYELVADYTRVVACVRDALARFAQGVYLVWYPIVRRSASAQLPERLARLARAAPKGWLHASLTVGEPDEEGFGMSGSGIVVINPPHTLRAALAEALPWLREALGRSPRARFTLEDDSSRPAAAPAWRAPGVRAAAPRPTMPARVPHVRNRSPR
jgi:23S rRNA (adenine2030-N6)-methyltransferase